MWTYKERCTGEERTPTGFWTVTMDDGDCFDVEEDLAILIVETVNKSRMLPLIRIRYQKQGRHYHCRLFTAPEPDRTFAKCGHLVFDEHEWPLVKTKLAQYVQFIEEQS